MPESRRPAHEDDYGLPVVGPALTEVEESPEVEKAANATALTPQQKEALLALSLHMQNGLNGELLEKISRDEALEVVKSAFSAVSTARPGRGKRLMR